MGNNNNDTCCVPHSFWARLLGRARRRSRGQYAAPAVDHHHHHHHHHQHHHHGSGSGGSGSYSGEGRPRYDSPRPLQRPNRRDPNQTPLQQTIKLPTTHRAMRTHGSAGNVNMNVA